MSQFQILKPDRNHLPQIVKLIREFAEFENLIDSFSASEEKLNEAIFGANAFVRSLIAPAENEIIAYALFYPVFKSFRGERGIFLEDLYVSRQMRGKGLGLSMLKAVARAAKEQGFVRMDWQALKWNTPAVNFYKNLGAETDDENLDFRLRGENFENLAS